jgi:hypothetical protein
MAREIHAVFDVMAMGRHDGILFTSKELERFAALVRADERDACAKVCDDKHDTWRWDDEPDSASGPRDCAAAIRARGNT